MTKTRDVVLAANEAYAADFGDKAKLPMPPARRFAAFGATLIVSPSPPTPRAP